MPKCACMWKENEDCDKVRTKVVVIINNSKMVVVFSAHTMKAGQ